MTELTLTASQRETIAFLNAEFAKIFPDSNAWVRARRIIGETCIHITYTNAKSADECSSRILENDPAFMSFAIWNDDKGGFYIDNPTQHRNVLRGLGIRFVTMKGATEQECATKLVKFMTKHAAAFVSLGKNKV